jgi:hypothetical protein
MMNFETHFENIIKVYEIPLSFPGTLAMPYMTWIVDRVFVFMGRHLICNKMI